MVPDYRVINNVVFQVAHGLAVLHKGGYVHRGIIPQLSRRTWPLVD